MSCELVGTVFILPLTPVKVMVDNPVDITGRYTLNGPGSGGPGCTYAMNWVHDSPGFPYSFANEDPVAPDTDYVKTWLATLPIGEHRFHVDVTHTDPNIPAVFITSSQTIVVEVIRRIEPARFPD